MLRPPSVMEDTVKGPAVSTLTSAARVSLKLCPGVKVPADVGVRLTAVVAGGGGEVTLVHAENSEVVPPASVAVDVIAFPAAGPETIWVNDALPFTSVVRGAEPRKIAPSPFPLPLQDVLEKNSIENDAFAVLFSVPLIVVLPMGSSWADVRTGKLLAPPGVFGLTPAGVRSIPIPAWPEIEFKLRVLPVPAAAPEKMPTEMPTVVAVVLP